MLEFEFSAIDSDKYIRVYHEGRTGKPICPYAESRGLQVIYLGRDNPYQKVALERGKGGEKDHELQRKKEGVWLAKVEPSPLIEESLLIVGQRHARNDFGLVDNLSDKGIELVEIANFGQYSRTLESRLHEEAANGLAVSTGLDIARILETIDKVIIPE